MQQKQLGYPYCYGNIVTPEISRKNRNQLITILLILWSLNVRQVIAAPIPGADAFSSTYICRKKQTYSREASSLSIHLKKNPNNQNIPKRNRALYDRAVGDSSILTDRQIRRKFKHAPSFGVLGNPNRRNFELFKDRIVEHMMNPLTTIKAGTYKKNIEVFHYFNEKTGLNVMIRQDDNTFLSGWKLKDDQIKNLKSRGAL